jgi:phosphoribosylglycinamide formyltransferase-1
MSKSPVNIALFASGNGSNVQNIVEFFHNNPVINPNLIFTNKADAFVIERAKNLNIPCIVFKPSELRDGQIIREAIQEFQIDFIVLAGFLLKIPDYLIELFPQKIINIHPALLPKFGGKGMYGDFVHQAVKDSGDTETGITVHYVNREYDEGQIIFQKKVPVLASDSPDDIAQKVHALEYEYFPKVIKDLLT